MWKKKGERFKIGEEYKSVNDIHSEAQDGNDREAEDKAEANLIDKTKEFKAKDYEVRDAKENYKEASGKSLPNSDGEWDPRWHMSRGYLRDWLDYHGIADDNAFSDSDDEGAKKGKTISKKESSSNEKPCSDKEPSDGVSFNNSNNDHDNNDRDNNKRSRSESPEEEAKRKKLDDNDGDGNDGDDEGGGDDDGDDSDGSDDSSSGYNSSNRVIGCEPGKESELEDQEDLDGLDDMDDLDLDDLSWDILPVNTGIGIMGIIEELLKSWLDLL